MDAPETPGWPEWPIRWVLLAIPPLMGVLALWLGQDASWDLRNYHFYNAYAFLHDRLGFDIAPAQVATFYNPLLHVPFYYLVRAVPPRMVGFGLGLLQGANIFLLYAIARRMIDAKRLPAAAWLGLAAAALGLMGAAGIAETGTSYGDNVVSLLVLAALWLIVRMPVQVAAGRAGLGVVLAAGLLAGAAFGLKQPFAVYAVGLCAAFFGLSLAWRRRLLLAFIFGLGVLAGTALTGGFWMLEMWRHYANPLFPYFNQYFHSPWGAASAYRDERFLPHNGLMAFFFPIWFSIHPTQVSEVPFRDLRFAVLFILLAAWLWTRLRAGFRRALQPDTALNASDASAAPRRFLMIFMIVSFVLWMKLFAVYRYLIVCEMLAPLAILLIMPALATRRRSRMLLVLGSFLLIALTLQPARWDRRPWSPAYFGVHAPPLAEPDKTIVLMSGYAPMAYMIPFFPPQVRFLRIHSYLTGPSPQPNETDRQMRDIIAGHDGPLYILYRRYEEDVALNALAFYGLALNRTEGPDLLPAVEPRHEKPFCFRAVAKVK